jgi:hypothetical protein
MSRGRKYRRECKHCGTPTVARRATCSEACRLAVVHTDARVARTCPVCASEFKVYGTSTQKCCGRACAAKLPKAASPAKHAQLKVRTCAQCSVSFQSETARATCSAKCRADRHAQHCEAMRGRSSVRASKRASAKRAAYRRTDKALVTELLLHKQGGRCAVCGSVGHALGGGSTGLVLDHCHTSGDARGMLCGRCNAALGLVRESPDVCKALTAYAQMCADKLSKCM